MDWLIILSLFLFNFTIMFWFIRYLDLRRSRIKKRVVAIEKKEWHETAEFDNKVDKEGPKSKLSSFLWKIVSRFKLVKYLDESLQNELKKANVLMKSNELVLVIFFFAIIGGVLGIIIADGSIRRGVWLSLFTWMLPLIWLNSKKKKRKVMLEAQLPEMITMTANSLKAGYSLLQSFELLSREMAKPLSEEIQRMLQEMRLGVTTELALKNFNQRIDSKDLDLIITAILIQRQVGGNLAEVLDTIGNTIRERIRIQGEIKSLTAQGRMSMLIFMILPFGLGAFLMVSNPDYMMTLFTNPLGIGMVVIAILGQILGAVMIRRIIDIEV
ncbi:hypothetical protein BHF71_08825 [Vulcanibacillus modesticaldus]|uniref:Type II secretion system protein GspF domain-containing protein n=1 Tax=Vulcanibacillus modesticaldus TaxID=337097 RepID=A0A1D2YUX2_9BACI|nr:type II secretion system F family protein [Vulcanibacillus modesticaldus]OEF99512.1 hypothetical protein BHF71_08825 [Vulcanibacillus modesticaldus]